MRRTAMLFLFFALVLPFRPGAAMEQSAQAAQPAAEESSTEEPSAEEPSTEEPPTVEPPTEEPPVRKPYLYSALRSGNVLSVRLDAPEGGLLLAAVYDAASGQMRDILTRSVEPDASTGHVPMEFERRPATSERVTVYLVQKDTLAPLCRAVLADMVVPSN